MCNCGEGKCCCGVGMKILAHVLSVVGIFMLSWGFLAATGTASWSAVFSSLFFWGLIIIGLGFHGRCNCGSSCSCEVKK